MKGAVFSNGGVLLTYTAGRLCNFRPNYDLVVASGDSAPFASLSALSEYDSLHDMVRSLNDDDIYGGPIFNGNGNSIIRPFLPTISGRWNKNRPSQTLIRQYLDRMVFTKLMQKERNLHLWVYNLGTGMTEKVVASEVQYRELMRYIAASMSIPYLLGHIKVNNLQYSSPFFINPLPIIECINQGCTSVDVYAHIPQDFKSRRVHKEVGKLYSFLSYIRCSLQDNLLSRGIAMARKHHVRMRVFYTPYNTINEWNFNTSIIDKYFKEGYAAHDRYLVEHYNFDV